MKIKRSSWHYKISNLGSDFERSNDNLCRYFWRGAGKLALLLAAAIVVCFLVPFAIYNWFTDDFVISNTIMFFFICSVFILPPLAIHFLRKRFGPPEMPYENIVIAKISATKRKVCPLIEYV